MVLHKSIPYLSLSCLFYKFSGWDWISISQISLIMRITRGGCYDKSSISSECKLLIPSTSLLQSQCLQQSIAPQHWCPPPFHSHMRGHIFWCGEREIRGGFKEEAALELNLERCGRIFQKWWEDFPERWHLCVKAEMVHRHRIWAHSSVQIKISHFFSPWHRVLFSVIVIFTHTDTQIHNACVWKYMSIPAFCILPLLFLRT